MSTRMVPTAASVGPTVPRPWALVAVSIVPLVALGVIVTAVLVLVAGLWGLLAGLVVTAVVVALRARRLTSGIRQRVLTGMDVRSVDAGTHARLLNVADGLSATSGVPVPDLFVLDDPAANLMLVGESEAAPAVVITAGLLDALDRIELEAVVARAFVELRQGGVPAATVATGAMPPSTVGGMAGGGAMGMLTRPLAGLATSRYRRSLDPDHDLLLDQAAVALTRYPPGLIRALERLEEVGTHVNHPDPTTAHLWIADPGVDGPATGPRPALELRHEALRLL